MELNKLGKFIEAERTARGWSYRAMQAECGITYSHLWNVEHGICDLTIMNAERVAQAFKLSLVEMLIASGYEYDPNVF